MTWAELFIFSGSVFLGFGFVICVALFSYDAWLLFNIMT